MKINAVRRPEMLPETPEEKMNYVAKLTPFIASTILTFAMVAAPFVLATSANAAETDSNVISAGVWTKKSFKSAGEWSIVEKAGKRYVVLSDDFKTRKAPDLKIFLSPTPASETNGGNATDGSLLIAPLASNKGGQTYEIPADADLSDYASILIHCEAYSKLWSAAAL